MIRVASELAGHVRGLRPRVFSCESWSSAVRPATPKNVARTAAAAVALFVAGCSAGTAVDHGPLGSGGGGGYLCAPVSAKSGFALSYGAAPLANTGSGAARISRVSLQDPHHVQLLASWAVPILGHFDFGATDGYPPGQNMGAGIDWARAQRAPGAILAPMHGRQHDDLVVVIRSGAPIGTVRAFNVFYRENGTSYQLQSHIPVKLTRSHCPG